MTFKALKFFGLLLFVFAFLAGCSGEDNASNPANQEGGEIFRSQMVTVDIGNAALSDHYTGTIAGIDVELTKTEDHKLMFLVPFEASLGAQELEISGLNHTVHYEVKNTPLPGSASQVIAGFSANLATFAATLDSSPQAASVQTAINSFNAVFENASDAEKIRVATLYQANKAAFDDIILNDFSSITGRSIEPGDIALLSKHSYAVYFMAAGAIVAIWAPEPIEKALGIGVTAIGAYKAYKFFEDISTKKLNTVTLAADNIIGVNDRTGNTIEFEHNVGRVVSLNAFTRPFIAADASKTQPKVVDFFKAYNKYNYWINLVNDVIEWVNANVPFANVDLITLEQLPTTVPQSAEAVTASTFSNITFSVDHPNLTLVSATLQASGQLNVKVKIEGNPTTLPVESHLNYSYNDAVSTFTGKLPISVNNQPIPTGEVQFTMDGVDYTAPVSFVQPSGGANCVFRVGYQASWSGGMMSIVFDLGNYFDNKPVGTVYQFQCGYSPGLPGFTPTTCASEVVEVRVSFDDGNDMTIDMVKESLPARGTLIKTGNNSFEFAGEVGFIGSEPGIGYYIDEPQTVQISGSGTY